MGTPSFRPEQQGQQQGTTRRAQEHKLSSCWVVRLSSLLPFKTAAAGRLAGCLGEHGAPSIATHLSLLLLSCPRQRCPSLGLGGSEGLLQQKDSG